MNKLFLFLLITSYATDTMSLHATKRTASSLNEGGEERPKKRRKLKETQEEKETPPSEVCLSLDTIEKISTIVRCNTQQYSYDDALKLWKSTSRKDKDSARKTLQSIAQDDTHPNQWDAVMKLWSSNKSRDIAHNEIQRMAQDDAHLHQWNAITKLWIKADLRDQESIRKKLQFIAHNDSHPNQWNAILQLLNGNKDDKEMGHSIEQRIAYNNQHPRHIDALMKVWNRKKGRDAVRAALHLLAKDVAHPNQWDASLTLLVGSKDDQEVALKGMLFIAQDDKHPNQWNAVMELWFRDKEKDLIQSLVSRIAQDATHPSQCDAAYRLWIKGTLDDQEIARPTLYRVAEDATHPKQIETAIELWQKGTTDDQEIARPTLYRVAQDATHPKQIETAYTLWDKGSLNDRIIARPALYHAVSDVENNSYQWRIAHTLWNKGDEEDKSIARPIVHHMAQNDSFPNQWITLNDLWNKGNASDKNRTLQIMRSIANNQSHPNQWEAFLQLWVKGTAEDKSKALHNIRSIASNQNHPKQWMAAHALWTNGTVDKAIARPILHIIAQSNNHLKQWIAAFELWNKGNQDDKAIARPVMHHASQDETHPMRWIAAFELWNKGNQDDKAIARPVMHFIVQNNPFFSENKRLTLEGTILRPIDFAWGLYVKGNLDDQKVAREGLRFLSQNDNPFQWKAQCMLFQCGTSEDQDTTRKKLSSVALDDNHSNQMEAAQILWTKGNANDQDMMRPALYRTAQNDQDSRQYYAASILWTKGTSDDQDIARPVIHRMTQSNNQITQRSAANHLWFNGNADDKVIARNVFIKMVNQSNLNLSEIKSIIRVFRESSDSADQALGIEWLLLYFPTHFSENLMQKINAFNQVKFKTTAQPALESLEAIEMDVPSRFETLMNGMETKDENAPNYVHFLMITGQSDPTGQVIATSDNTIEIGNLKKRALGFLKTLTNQPLAEGEQGGWQMHDENKPALINAMKHLIQALEGTEDSATRFNNLGIILRGLLYCPTGQVEGINSAVNTLVRGQNRMVGTFDDRMAHIIHDAVDTAFLQAFGQGSNVHALSRARSILHPHIGLQQAVTGFIERISRALDAEVPFLLNQFYHVFTKEFLSTYVFHHLQTSEDVSDLSKQAHEVDKLSKDEREQLQKSIAHAKNIRPLSITDYSEWLTSHNLSPLDYGFEYDENEDADNDLKTVITKEHMAKLLEKMGWIKSPQ